MILVDVPFHGILLQVPEEFAFQLLLFFLQCGQSRSSLFQGWTSLWLDLIHHWIQNVLHIVEVNNERKMTSTTNQLIYQSVNQSVNL